MNGADSGLDDRRHTAADADVDPMGELSRAETKGTGSTTDDKQRGDAPERRATRRKTLFGIGALGAAASGIPVASANGSQGRNNGNDAQSLDTQIVLDWVDEALETARQGLIIPTSGRVYAFLGTVMYDAVNGIHQQRGAGFEAGDQYAVDPDVVPGACRVAALAGAANEVLSRLAEEELDDETAADLQDRYDELFEEHLDEYQDGNQEAGEMWGRQVATEMLEDERGDAEPDCESTFDIAPDKETDLEPGMAQLTDAWGSACLADLKPWGLDEPDSVEAPEPPELDSLEFAVEYNRTIVVGDVNKDENEIQETEVTFSISEDRYDDEEARDLVDGNYVADDELGYSNDLEYDEDEQKLTLTIDPPDDFREQGAFWAALGGTPQPEGRWLQVAGAAVEKEGPDFYETVRLYARLGIAVQDAGIANWNNTRRYAEELGWRPHAAIGTEKQTPEGIEEIVGDLPDADDLDNPDLETKDDWEAISGWAPAPEYASGLTTVSTTSQRLLEKEFGDVGTLEVTVDTAEGNTFTEGDELTEEFDGFDDARDQAAKSRVWSGRHYAPAMLAAIDMADQIVEEVEDTI